MQTLALWVKTSYEVLTDKDKARGIFFSYRTRIFPVNWIQKSKSPDAATKSSFTNTIGTTRLPPATTLVNMTDPSAPQSDAFLLAESPQKLDAPKVAWTVADAAKQFGGNRFAVTYHVLATPWGVFSPLGCFVGAGLYGLGLGPASALLPSMGATGLTLGCLGAGLGLTRKTLVANQGAAATPIPWTDDGIQKRLNGLSHNFFVRILDVSTWSGIALASSVLVVAGGPTALGLSKGTFGVLQGLTLGSSLGSLGAFGCVYAAKKNKK
jgi:hypothetical protein